VDEDVCVGVFLLVWVCLDFIVDGNYGKSCCWFWSTRVRPYHILYTFFWGTHSVYLSNKLINKLMSHIILTKKINEKSQSIKTVDWLWVIFGRKTLFW